MILLFQFETCLHVFSFDSTEESEAAVPVAEEVHAAKVLHLENLHFVGCFLKYSSTGHHSRDRGGVLDLHKIIA
jgi:hypothetical protein